MFERMEARVLAGEGHTDPGARRAAAAGQSVAPELERLLAKVRAHAHRVTDADVEAVRSAGYEDDAVFELTIAAAIGVARGRLDRALHAIAAFEQEEAR
jgi:alkylhydroperoxidase family enzyme